MQVARREQAEAKRTSHQFVPGAGYLAHGGPPDVKPTKPGSFACDPPAGTEDGSPHFLQPPTGGAPVEMLWVAGEGAWAPHRLGKGNRMAWPSDYLKAHGWKYVGPKAGGFMDKARALLAQATG
jgi:hypothetical protein